MRPGSPRAGRASARAERRKGGARDDHRRTAATLRPAKRSGASRSTSAKAAADVAGDQRRHYEMAHGSASEVTTALRIAVSKRYITPEDYAAVDVALDRVRAMLYRLTR